MRRRTNALSRHVTALAVGLFAGAVGVQTARAAGVEETVGGAVAIGRSAGYVRANDYQAVWQNPANLTVLPRKDLGLELRVPVFDGCFDRVQNPNTQYLPTESFDKVCNEGVTMPTGSVGFAMPLPKNFGFGVGIFTPGGTPKLKFGHSDINTLHPSGETLPVTMGVNEAPNRFLLIDKTVLAVFLMAGVGYSPIPQLRFGLSVGGGVIDVKFRNVTSVQGGTFLDPQILSDVSVVDAFVPRTTLSVAATPIDSIDLMASFTYTDDVSAKGDLKVTANGFDRAPLNDCIGPNPGPRCKVDDVKLNIPYQRFEVLIGGRYAQRRNKRERTLDPMKDEVWDVELNAYWVQTSHVDNYTLKIQNPRTVEDAANMRPFEGIQTGTAPGTLKAPLPNNATLFHGWKDTYGVRVGGDYNVLPQLLAVRAGLGFETRGVPAKNMNVDYWPVQRVTLSLGATVALGRWKIHAAYAHIFQEDVNVKVGQGNVREVVAYDPQMAQAVNEGKFTSRLNVFSLQGNVQF